jgi:hypothetical protein
MEGGAHSEEKWNQVQPTRQRAKIGWSMWLVGWVSEIAYVRAWAATAAAAGTRHSQTGLNRKNERIQRSVRVGAEQE